jgi:iron-sulfur cluster repair protein YtfE (RIC family)
MSTPLATAAEVPTISETLGRDHDRIDHLLLDVVTCVGDGELERAESTFDEFDHALRRHISVEEELLFPLFETRHASGHHPVNVMTIEHRAIQRRLDAMRDTLARGDAPAFLAEHDLLLRDLGPHNMKEERFLYPAIDQVLTPSERAAMGHRLAHPAG